MIDDKQDAVAYKGGAQRSDKLLKYRLMPLALMQDVADALTEGHEKYCEGPWDSNWRRGDQEFFIDAIDHLIEHLFKWITITFDPKYAARNFSAEDLAENHLAHLTANVAFISWADKMEIFTPDNVKCEDSAEAEDFESRREIARAENAGKTPTISIHDPSVVGRVMSAAIAQADGDPGLEAETQNSTESPTEAEAEETVTQPEVPPSPSPDIDGSEVLTGAISIAEAEKEAALAAREPTPAVDWFTRTFGKQKSE